MKRSFIFTLSASAILFVVFSLIFLGNKSKESEKKVASAGCAAQDLSGKLDLSEDVAYFEGQKIQVPNELLDTKLANVLGVASEERWIEVDLSDQKLYAWEGDRLYLETSISSGLPWTPTPTGEFRIWIKLRATKMEGGEGKSYYYLPNVPYVMFFQNENLPGWKGYSLHGTYWHNDFGNPHSHGCVNLPTEMAAKIYDWVSPVLEDGKTVVRASEDNIGTRIVIHE